jgi:hypothetical protein
VFFLCDAFDRFDKVVETHRGNSILARCDAIQTLFLMLYKPTCEVHSKSLLNMLYIRSHKTTIPAWHKNIVTVRTVKQDFTLPNHDVALHVRNPLGI